MTEEVDPRYDRAALDATAQSLVSAPISDGTGMAISNIVEYMIEKEYGANVENELKGATAIAVAGMTFDKIKPWLEHIGTTAGLDALARTLVRMEVAKALLARMCQCAGCRDNNMHRDYGPCAAHTEADVPELDGKLLCGPCHIARYRLDMPRN